MILMGCIITTSSKKSLIVYASPCFPSSPLNLLDSVTSATETSTFWTINNRELLSFFHIQYTKRLLTFDIQYVYVAVV